MSATHQTRKRILAYLQSGQTVSTRNGGKRFGVAPSTLRARISELRKAGYPIYTNSNPKGQSYRLGKPTRRVIAAGHLVLTDKFFKKQLRAEIAENMKLAE